MSDMEAEVEEASFLPGEKILNKKAVYEPSSTQRCQQLVCSRRWAVSIFAGMGFFALLIASIAAFARPSVSCQTGSNIPALLETASPSATSAKSSILLATNGQPFPWKDIRLPRNIIPDHYHIFIHPNLSQSHFSGNVNIFALVVSATDFIVFHVKDLNITDVKVLRGEVEVEKKTLLENKQHEQIYLKLSDSLAKGTKIKIIVHFEGTLENKLAGFYKSSYKTSKGEIRNIATTHFEPTDARAAFPCFDEPDMKANFSMTLIREKHHIALFNMPLLTTTTYKNDLMQDDFETSVQMSTYLVAFIICDFKNVSSVTQQNVLVRVFAPEEQIHMAQYALQVAVKVLDYYTSFFDVPYPLPKQDMVAIPDFGAGAMENWGLITYRMTSILYDPLQTSASGKQWIATVVAHELAHQWFGNIVTMEWWDDLWLNEGFASFMEYIGVNIADADFHMEEQFVSDSLQNALFLDSFTSSHPIQAQVKNPAEINEIFDKISYDKGACLIRMLQSVVGKDQFQRGLSTYLKSHAYGNARTADLWDAIQSVSSMSDGLTVAQMMDTWTMQMGYPVISVSSSPGSGNLTLRQNRFLLGCQLCNQDSNNISPFNYTWIVPFQYITSASPDKPRLVWINEREVSVPYPRDVLWIKGNYRSLGLYRVNYEETMWKKIIEQLMQQAEVFSPEDRAGLLDDAFALARTGQLKYSILFELLAYLKHETHLVPWETIISAYSFIKNRMYLTDEYPILQAYMLDLVSGHLSNMGWEEKNGHLDQLLQERLLSFATQLDHRPTIDAARQKFNAWMENSTSIQSNLRTLAYKTGVKYGDDKAWQYVWQKYLSSTIPTEKRQMMQALANTMDPRRLQLFLRDSLNKEKIRTQDVDTIIRGVANNKAGHMFSWHFVQQNWDTLYQRYGEQSFMFGNIIKGVVEPFNTQYDYENVQHVFANHQLGSGRMALKQALETVQTHIEWTARYQQDLSKWLNEYSTRT